MLLSELFIIYLAAAAPFGVSRFLAESAKGTRRRRALLNAACAALAWPFTSLPAALSRVSFNRRAAEAEDEGRGAEQLTRAAVNALREVEDLLACVRECAGARQALYAARECVERYAGLAHACASADAGAGPSPREMELCRIAGRAGDDLLVAGRCVHRRNVTRLFAHRERARAEIVRTLEDVREVAHGTYAARQASVFAGPAPGGPAGHTDGADARRLRAAMSEAFSRVAELLSLFGDGATAEVVTRLLPAEDACEGEGEDPCTTRAVPTAFATRRLRTPTPQGG